MSLNRKLTDEELNIIQEEVDQVYIKFMNIVAEGRDMTVQQVNKIARGRVWTGRDALKIGLVDKLGGVSDVINYAAKKSNIKNMKVLYYPLKEEDPIADLIEKLEEETNSNSTSGSIEIPSSLMDYLQKLKSLEYYSGIQMRLPYEINIR